MEAIKQEPIGPTIGHNQPPLPERLKSDHADLMKRAAELMEAYLRAPAEIKDDMTLGKIGDLGRLLSACSTKCEVARKDEKEPFILGGKTVDTFFRNISDPLDKALVTLRSRSTIYTNAKIAAERKRLADEEAAKRAEAAKALEAAQKAADAGRAKTADRHLAKADQAQAAAEQAAHDAQAPVADLTRTRGEISTVTTAMRWVHEVTDWPALIASLGVMGAFLSRDDIEKGIRACIRQNKDAIAIPGVRIFQSASANFR